MENNHTFGRSTDKRTGTILFQFSLTTPSLAVEFGRLAGTEDFRGSSDACVTAAAGNGSWATGWLPSWQSSGVRVLCWPSFCLFFFFPTLTPPPPQLSQALKVYPPARDNILLQASGRGSSYRRGRITNLTPSTLPSYLGSLSGARRLIVYNDESENRIGKRIRRSPYSVQKLKLQHPFLPLDIYCLPNA